MAGRPFALSSALAALEAFPSIALANSPTWREMSVSWPKRNASSRDADVFTDGFASTALPLGSLN